LDALASAKITTARDLIFYFPRRYLDRSAIKPIRTLAGTGEPATVVGTVKKVHIKGYRNKKRLEVFISDGNGFVKGVWFRGADYFKRLFKEGDEVAFFGPIKRYGRYLSIAHPDFEKLKTKDDLDSLARIIPIYPSNKKFSRTRINSDLIQQWITTLLKYEDVYEFIPDDILQNYNMPERMHALHLIHNPQKKEDYHRARYRFKFEDFFLFQLSLAQFRNQIKTKRRGPAFEQLKPLTTRFFNHQLPFTLTDGQKSALKDIKNDVTSGHQMNRLIQGDVGSGKTVVAVGALLMALDNGYQGAFMAPTEILAEQHYRTLTKFLDGLDVNVRLLVGSQKKGLRMDVLTSIEGGQCNIVVGTHAIIQDLVQFNRLGLVIIDEQHRFGVQQRASILNKGSHPHLLVMSATPIPRSLAMTLYGDLDISLIKQLPAGRKPIITAVRNDGARSDIYAFIKKQIDQGGQTYMVYPLVEESEALDLKDATLGYEKICGHFENAEVGLLHGKMSSEEKDAVMQAFKKGELQILVSTTVIEVGVDVPNANVMVIEHAERFGLSQLHQLRGRIGRGERQSYCILMAGDNIGKTGWQRLKTMERTNSGFEVAEVDLKMRGPGDFMGTNQSGLPDFNIADIVEDQPILEKAKQESVDLFQKDPQLRKNKHRALKEHLETYMEEKGQYITLL